MYRERTTRVPLTVLWQRRTADRATPGRLRILPDGCLDLIYDGATLTVAGPDPVARWHTDNAGQRYAALRLAGGTGPALLGVPADELVGRSVPLEDLWPAAAARRLSEAVAADPASALCRWLEGSDAVRDLDPVGPRLLTLARQQTPVARMADLLGFSARQLQRRSLAAFGYGPRRLSRVVRLQGALDGVRTGIPLAEVAAGSGYADQAHLSRDIRELTGETPHRLARELTSA